MKQGLLRGLLGLMVLCVVCSGLEGASPPSPLSGKWDGEAYSAGTVIGPEGAYHRRGQGRLEVHLWTSL